MVQNPLFMQLESVGIIIANKFNSKIIVLYVVVSPSKNEYANLTGFVTTRQIDMIIQNAKEEAKDWFKRIQDMVKTENPDIKLTTTVRVTGEAIYGEIIHYVEKESIDLIVPRVLEVDQDLKNYYWETQPLV